MFLVLSAAWKFFRFGCSSILLPSLKIEFLVKRSCRDKRIGVRLCRFLENMGPSFIKFGQILSMRADILGGEIVKDLSHLRDRLDPFPFKRVEEAVEEAFGKPLGDIFEDFHPEPVSAASVAQIHKAKLNGQDVAVKVLRPNIGRRFARDMKLFRSLSRFARLISPRRVERLNLERVLDIFESTVEREINLMLEGASAERLRKETADLPQVEIPEVFWAATSEKCLTISWVNGVPLEKLDRGDRKLASEILIHTLFHQTIRNGFFHGDLHSGNILFNTEKKKLILVDFGIVGWLSMELRIFLVKIFRGSIKRDYKMVAQAHQDMGLLPEGTCMETFTLACSAVILPIVDLPAKDISCSRLLSRLMQLAESFQVRLQPELLLLHKTLISAEGISRQLNPNLNIWNISEDVMENWIRENYKSLDAFRRNAKNHVRRLLDLLKWIEDAPKRN